MRISPRVSRLIILFLLLASCKEAIAQVMPVPPKLQAAIFAKVFTYTKTFLVNGQVEVLVTFNNQSEKIKDEMVTAFEDLGISARAVHISELSDNFGRGSVVYITAGTESTKQFCKEEQLLSITGIPALVKSGEASIGLGIENYRPQVIVDMRQLKAEGHALSSQLLRLAKVLR